MKAICKYLVDTLGLDKETYDIIYYGLFVVVTNLISILSVLFFGFLLGEFYETFLFLLFFGPLRLYLGGYHASSPMKCYILFNVISIAFIMMFKVDINIIWLTFTTFILLCFVFAQLIKLKQDKKVIVIVLIYMIATMVLKKYIYLNIFLLSVLMNVVLYGLKLFLSKSK